MRISEIRKFPTTFIDVEIGKSHESILRAFHILNKVKELLHKNTPQDVILEIIEECEASKVNI